MGQKDSNRKNTEEQTEELSVGFNVDSTGETRVDASVVGKSVTAMDAILKELHKEFQSNSELLVKARPFKKGSLEIPIDLIVVASAALVSFPILENMLRCLSEYFKLKRELKGSAPKLREGKIIIQDSVVEIDKVVIDLLDPENKSNKLIAVAFEEIENDKNVSEFKISRKTKRLAKVRREEFQYYRAPLRKEVRGQEVTAEESLLVIGPVFAEKGKWTLQRKGKNVHMDIQDEDFIQRVLERGEPFRSGDKLRVELKILQEYDAALGAYTDRQYTIKRIINHIKRRDTGELFE